MKWGERQPGKLQPKEIAMAPIGQTLYGRRLRQIGYKRDFGLGGGIDPHDSKTPDFDQSVQRRWCGC